MSAPSSTPPSIPQTSETNDLVGQKFGNEDRYEIKEFLEETSQVQRYLAHDHKLSRDVALKIFLEDQEPLAQTQLGIYSSFQHPNVSPLLDATVVGKQKVHVIKLAKGYPLQDLVGEDTGLAANEIFEFAPQLLDVLVTLHDRGYLHLSLAPSSVLLSTEWDKSSQYLVKNFINACKMDEEGQWSNPKPGMFRDYFQHAAPEVLNGGTADVRSDLFSLGALIYHSFCGQPPFQGDSPIETSDSHQSTTPVHLGYYRSEIPVEIADWVMSLLEVDAEKRPANALEALKSFKAIKASAKKEEVNEDSRVA